MGPGAATLSVSERCQHHQHGRGDGRDTSIFPADEQVRKFLKAEKREEDFTEILPDADAEYDGEMELNLSELVPLCAYPHQPDQCHSVKGCREKESTAGLHRKLHQLQLFRYREGSLGIQGKTCK